MRVIKFFIGAYLLVVTVWLVGSIALCETGQHVKDGSSGYVWRFIQPGNLYVLCKKGEPGFWTIDWTREKTVPRWRN